MTPTNTVIVLLTICAIATFYGAFYLRSMLSELKKIRERKDGL